MREHRNTSRISSHDRASSRRIQYCQVSTCSHESITANLHYVAQQRSSELWQMPTMEAAFHIILEIQQLYSCIKPSFCNA